MLVADHTFIKCRADTEALVKTLSIALSKGPFSFINVGVKEKEGNYEIMLSAYKVQPNTASAEKGGYDVAVD